MRLRFKILEILLNTLAEWECGIGRTGIGERPQKWRKRYLQLMRVQHGKNFTIGRNLHIRNKGGLELGENCGIGSFSRIWNYAPIIIGDDFLAAGGLTLNSATHDPVTLKPFGEPIHIGHRVWCGVNVTILAGVTIGNDVVIGAGSVVISDIPPNCIAAGVPARKIKDLQRNDQTKIWRWSDESNPS